MTETQKKTYSHIDSHSHSHEPWTLPPVNSPTMHSRLLLQDQNLCFGEPAFLSKNPYIFKTHKIVQTFENVQF